MVAQPAALRLDVTSEPARRQLKRLRFEERQRAASLQQRIAEADPERHANSLPVLRQALDLPRSDPEARWQSWHRARPAGVLSPNDIKLEEGWPASGDPTANSIEPRSVGQTSRY